MSKTIRASHIFAEKSHFGREVRLFLANEDHKQSAVFGPASFEMINDDGLTIHEPTLSLDGKTAQRLMDALWECGIRPNNGEGMDSQVSAIKYHLEDMRKLVFKESDK